MQTEAGAPPQGNSAESLPAPEAEQDKPAGQEQASDQPSDEAQGVDDAEPRDEGRRKRGLGERALEYRNQARDLARVNERLLNLMEQTLSGKAPQVEQPSGPPQRENFESYEAYLEAKADFQVAQKLKEVETRAERARQEAAIKEREADWQQRQKAAAKKYEDFAEVTMADDLAITPIMAEAIKDSDMGPDVAYYLGKNPDLAEKIARLNPAAQVREIGKIEARLEINKEPVKRPSKAPAPIEPVSGGKASTVDPGQMSQAEYEAWRKKQGAWWAR
jgi:hypothetical protein